MTTSNSKRLPISLMSCGNSGAVHKDHPKKTGTGQNSFFSRLEHNPLSAPDNGEESGRDFRSSPDSELLMRSSNLNPFPSVSDLL